MAVIKRRFYYHEDGSHAETWYYLARDTVTGRAFIIHSWAFRADVGSKNIEIREFLRDTTSAQSKLLSLIGSLVQEDDKYA